MTSSRRIVGLDQARQGRSQLIGTEGLSEHRAVESAIAEVCPALWSRGFAREDRTGDQHDAFSIAAWLSIADRDGCLAAALNPGLTAAERSVAQVEGWILGVGGTIGAKMASPFEGASTTRH